MRFDADEDELLILTKEIPERIRQRVLERPDAFNRLARLNDEALNRLLEDWAANGQTSSQIPTRQNRGSYLFFHVPWSSGFMTHVSI